jgi:hypothetical protein
MERQQNAPVYEIGMAIEILVLIEQVCLNWYCRIFWGKNTL